MKVTADLPWRQVLKDSHIFRNAKSSFQAEIDGTSQNKLQSSLPQMWCFQKSKLSSHSLPSLIFAGRFEERMPLDGLGFGNQSTMFPSLESLVFFRGHACHRIHRRSCCMSSAATIVTSWKQISQKSQLLYCRYLQYFFHWLLLIPHRNLASCWASLAPSCGCFGSSS